MRVHTLPASIAPILTTIAYALIFFSTQFSTLNAILAAIVAITAQICSNYANDLIDFKNNRDTSERKGFVRPLSTGAVTEKEVKMGLLFWFVLMSCAGIWLIINSHWYLLFVGVAVALGIFAYSGGPYPLSTHGLGDIAVSVFYGLVPMVGSFYAITDSLPDNTFWHLAVAMGIASTSILIVNNYRDYEEDLKTGKKTSIVIMGKDFAPKFYMFCGMLSVILIYPLFSMMGMMCIMLYVLLFFMPTYKKLLVSSGSELNKVLALTGRNVFILSVVYILVMLLHQVRI